MDRTTFADPDVASLIDKAFVPVRVDADRQPDVNERYNLGGWPTTVFLTSSGAILSGGTYLSAAQMIAALHQISEAYPTVRSVRLPASAEATAGLAKARGDRASDGGQPDQSINHFRSLLLDRFDPVHGGFGTSPKLPHPYALLFALSLPEDRELSQVVTFTLERLSALWDPIRGRLLSIRGCGGLEPSRHGEDSRRQRRAASRLRGGRCQRPSRTRGTVLQPSSSGQGAQWPIRRTAVFTTRKPPAA